jgi:large subunit ribosomal protein L29
MKASELRDKTETELRERFNLSMQRGTGQFSRPHLMKDVRRNIARVKTVINQKRQAGEA